MPSLRTRREEAEMELSAPGPSPWTPAAQARVSDAPAVTHPGSAACGTPCCSDTELEAICPHYQQPDCDTRTEDKEFLHKEDIHEDLESQAEISENYAGDVFQVPKLGDLCDDVSERDWGVPEGRRLPQSLSQEGDFTPAAMGLLRGPLGEKDLDCNGFDSRFSLSPNLMACQEIPTEERPHPYDMGGQSFQHSVDLTGHEGVPTAESPLICNECGKTFRGN
ncbi:ZNF16 isoform 6, partial [Pan troglodytes]